MQDNGEIQVVLEIKIAFWKQMAELQILWGLHAISAPALMYAPLHVLSDILTKDTLSIYIRLHPSYI